MIDSVERRNEILAVLKKTDDPVSGTTLADKFGISRQVIVQDIALLKANGISIVSTNRGYMIEDESKPYIIVKVSHCDDELEKELNAIVDLGATVEDVFINHKVYGKINADLNISSRRDVKLFLEKIQSGVSRPLKNLTKNYHYHKISAESEEILEEVKKTLEEMGYLIN